MGKRYSDQYIEFPLIRCKMRFRMTDLTIEEIRDIYEKSKEQQERFAELKPEYSFFFKSVKRVLDYIITDDWTVEDLYDGGNTSIVYEWHEEVANLPESDPKVMFLKKLDMYDRDMLSAIEENMEKEESLENCNSDYAKYGDVIYESNDRYM